MADISNLRGRFLDSHKQFITVLSGLDHSSASKTLERNPEAAIGSNGLEFEPLTTLKQTFDNATRQRQENHAEDAQQEQRHLQGFR